MSRGVRTRVVAARAVARVIGDGASLSDALPPLLETLDDARDRALAQAIAYGVLRFYPRLDLLLEPLIDRPLRQREYTLRALLLVGLYQIGYMTVPDHAAVDATVGAAPAIGRKGARGLVNAVLRRYQRDRELADATAVATAVGRFAHPAWIIERLRVDWPGAWEDVLAANNERPPMWLRINQRLTDRDRWRAMADVPRSCKGAHATASLCLERPVDVSDLPGFSEGLVSVQDAGAQLAAQLVAPASGERVLDACAAPGGKTGHLLELCPDHELTAIDIDAGRLALVEDNLARLGMTARLVNADAGRSEDWWDGQYFDAILLDAPCSASGVIRRHPDIKCLRRESDVATLATRQADLLEGLWPLLRPGGRLVYCTCSVFAAEGNEQIASFVRHTPDAVAALTAIPDGWGHLAGPGRQILPGEAAMDGFYYACLTKSD